jgi:hypothetical protein
MQIKRQLIGQHQKGISGSCFEGPSDKTSGKALEGPLGFLSSLSFEYRLVCFYD